MSAKHAFKLGSRFALHRAETYPHLAALGNLTTVEATKEEMLRYHAQAFTIRRMEITCDQEYKNKRIRGFLHLADGSECASVGPGAVLTPEDSWITTYRCHGVAYVRGVSVYQIFSELFGNETGISRGKGGSMHLYNKRQNFYGGAAIVGAHVPVGAGLAFEAKYRAKDPKNIQNCSIVAYGDGAANQGQVWEAANMAKLWGLPVIHLIEDNQYGMGTSVARSSSQTEYYKMGADVIPGVKVDGMDVLAMRECIRACKKHVLEGNGPVYVHARLYRFHGHSMSDPGISYRTREEVENVRQTRDPIELIKARIVEAGFATPDELKEREREIRGQVADALAKAIAAGKPPAEDLYRDILTTGKEEKQADDRVRMESEYPPEVRMPDRTQSRVVAR